MRPAKLLPLLAAALLSACSTIEVIRVPDVQGGQPFALSPELADSIHVRHVRADAESWIVYDYVEEKEPDNHGAMRLDREMELTDTLEEEVAEELRECARGQTSVDVSIFLKGRYQDDRLRSLVDGNGADTLEAIVEFVEPYPSNRVLGRYFLTVGSRSGNLLERIVGDRLMNGSEELGRELCLQAFGRNPRPSSWRNATK